MPTPRRWRGRSCAMTRSSRASSAGHGGAVVRPRGEGDSRFAVFARAADGVAAALAIQRALGAEAWPTPGPLRVRLALHTGVADRAPATTTAPRSTAAPACAGWPTAARHCCRKRRLRWSATTSRTRRVCATSGSTDCVGWSVRSGVPVAAPRAAGQIPAPDQPRDETPQPPAKPTALIGRERELEDVRDLLLREGVRLLTLTGPGWRGQDAPRTVLRIPACRRGLRRWGLAGRAGGGGGRDARPARPWRPHSAFGRCPVAP